MTIDYNDAKKLVRSQHGDREDGPIGVHLRSPIIVLWVALYIEIVYCAPLKGGAPNITVARWCYRIALKKISELRRNIVTDRIAQKLSIETEDESALRRAEFHCSLSQRFEYRLQPAWRTRDDPQHVRGRRLLFQRLAQLSAAGLHFLEQMHVLDGDHGLIGKGFQQLD